jgi:uncharacterized membrane protein YbhN (UPF0104 family)
MATRLIALAVTALALYGVAPAVLEVLGAFDDLDEVSPGWWPAVVGTQVAAVCCLVALQRVALQADDWFAVATSSLAGGALGRVVPGGAAAAGALQYRMLQQAGLPAARIGLGLTIGSLLLLVVLAALPLLALPSALIGRGVPEGLAQTGLAGLALFAALFAVGAVLLASDRAMRLVGRVVRSGARRVRRAVEPDLPERLVAQRDVARAALGRRWYEALAAAAGRWLFDLLTLVAALEALDARPRVALVLLAYCAAQLLAQIPITPGGLGVVEAGMIGTLALAGVPAGAAALATLTYRLASYWLQLPAGLAAWLLHRHRYLEPVPA